MELLDWRAAAFGAIAGAAMSSPIGPINLLILRSFLAHGIRGGAGFCLGAVLADSVLAAIAAFGASAVFDGIGEYSEPTRLVGGAAVAGMGLYALLRPRDIEASESSSLASHASSAAGGFVLTIGNPGTLAAAAAIFGGAGASFAASGFADAALMTAAFVVGSTLYWIAAATLLSACRARIAPETLALAGRISAVLIVLFGGAVALLAAVNLADVL